MDSPVLSSTRWRPSPGGTSRRRAPQMLTAPGERRIVGGGAVEAHHPEQGVQDPFGLAQREMGEGIVKLRLTAVSDAQHGGFTTGLNPASWGLID